MNTQEFSKKKLLLVALEISTKTVLLTNSSTSEHSVQSTESHEWSFFIYSSVVR